MVKSTGFSFRGPGFDSQDPCGGSQPSTTPVLGDLKLSSGLPGHRACVCWLRTDIHADKTPVPIQSNFKVCIGRNDMLFPQLQEQEA